MYRMKFLDGTPVPEEYARAVSKLVAGACEAEQRFGLDALEEHARVAADEAASRTANTERGG